MKNLHEGVSTVYIFFLSLLPLSVPWGRHVHVCGGSGSLGCGVSGGWLQHPGSALPTQSPQHCYSHCGGAGTHAHPGGRLLSSCGCSCQGDNTFIYLLIYSIYIQFFFLCLHACVHALKIKSPLFPPIKNKKRYFKLLKGRKKHSN